MTAQRLTIGELGQVVTGATPPSKEPALFGDTYPFITPSDMSVGSRRVVPERGISSLGYERFRSRVVPANTVSYTCIASIGKVCVTDRASLTNQQINSVVPHPNVCDGLFLYYLLRHETPRIRAQAGGVATPIINKSDFSNIELEIPPLPTQRRIASILSAYDDLIENNTRRIAILEEMAQAIYREWFVHFRFPGHEDVAMVDSEIGEIPEGWDVHSLRDLVDTQYGYTESAKDDPVGPRFLRGTDINKASFIDWERVPFCPISDSDFQKFRLSRGDIVVIRMADPGKPGIIESDVDAVFASYLVRMSIKSDQITPYFLFYTLLSQRYQGWVTGASTGTTRKSASAKVMTSFQLPIPPRHISSAFEESVAELRSLLSHLVRTNAVLRKTRDLLLPRLVSGEIDVNELDLEAPALLL